MTPVIILGQKIGLGNKINNNMWENFQPSVDFFPHAEKMSVDYLLGRIYFDYQVYAFVGDVECCFEHCPSGLPA